MKPLRSYAFAAALLVGASAGSPAAETSVQSVPNKALQAMLDRYADAATLFYDGKPEAVKALWSHADDVTLSGAAGGDTAKGWKDVSSRLDWASSQFLGTNGSKTIEQIQTAFHRALLLVNLDDAASVAGQRKILSKLTPDDFRSGEPIDNAVRVRVGLEQLEDIDEVHAADGISADADARRLADAERRELTDRFVRERAGARHDADVADLVNVARHDADLARPRRDDARAVRTDEVRDLLAREARDVLAILEDATNAEHVGDGNAFCDADDEIEIGVERLEDRVGRARRRNEDDGRVRAGRLHGLRDGVEDGNFAFELFATARRRDAADDVGAVFDHLLRVERARAAGDALNEKLGFFTDEDAHFEPLLTASTIFCAPSAMVVAA